MRYLVFSDIHGNLPAFEKVLKKEKDVYGYINLGDVVNYGPWSNECVQLINNLDNCFNLVGNHEDYFISGRCDVENPLVQKFFTQTYPDFNQNEKIKKYKNNIFLNGLRLQHTIDGKRYIFRDTKLTIQENMLIGHSHQQYVRYINGCFLLNPGSIGQNRKFINLSNYIVWDFETGEIELKKLKFDLKIFLSEMRTRKYPIDCIKYYENKNEYI